MKNNTWIPLGDKLKGVSYMILEERNGKITVAYKGDFVIIRPQEEPFSVDVVGKVQVDYVQDIYDSILNNIEDTHRACCPL